MISTRQGRSFSLTLAPSLFCLVALGCATGTPPAGPIAGPQLQGRVHGGQQPVSGAAIQLFAAGTTGYGIGAVSLLTAPTFTDSGGNFSLAGDYTCPAASSQLYIVGSGGNPGLAPGANNPALVLIAALGPCKLINGQYHLDPTTFVNIDEVTTVATAYALAGFMNPVTGQIGASATNTTGLANSFVTVQNLVNNAAGQALSTTPAGNGTVPTAEINTLADILAPCVNSNGSGTACSTLFSAATSTNGAAPTNTLQAILSIAQHPASNVTTLYNQAAAFAPFQPTLTSVPNDWTLQLSYTAYGSLQSGFAIDVAGDIWISNEFTSSTNLTSSITELANNGAILSGPAGYTGGGLSRPGGPAIDPAGNVWLGSATAPVLSEFSNSGTPLSPNGFPANASGPLAIDGFGDVWSGSSKFDNNGNPLTSLTGGGLIGLVGAISFDASENVWLAIPEGVIGGRDPMPYEGRVSAFTNTGVAISGANGYMAPSLYHASDVANDNTGNAWISSAYSSGSAITKIAPDGTILSGADGYQTGVQDLASIAVDGNGSVWAVGSNATYVNGSLVPVYRFVEVDNSGNVLSGASGFSAASPVGGIAIDSSGNIWMLGNSAVEVVGAATPVVTPLSVGVRDHKLGARP